MEYIRAGKEQIQEIIRLRIAFLEEDFEGVNEENIRAIEGQLIYYFNEHLNKDAYVYIAIDKEPIGMAILLINQKPANPNFPTGCTGLVMNVYTSKEYRRKGVAERLMDMLITHARSLNLDYIELEATPQGYGLYKKLGFEDKVSGNKSMKLKLGRLI